MENCKCYIESIGVSTISLCYAINDGFESIGNNCVTRP